MRTSFLWVAGALALSALAFPSEARACGGCFHIQQSETGQVTGHRMIFSVSPEATSLWDQISYAGSPETFAWVLPIHGQVQIGLSSDALFNQLESVTKVEVHSPDIECPLDPCGEGTGGGSPNSTFTTTSTSTGVTVIAQETVGPYETAQLSASDPLALNTWLDSHGYVIPLDVEPIIADYVAEGFDFLVMKLVPGEGVSSMRPVRVTSPGAGLSLPLRMVAAGTGEVTPISLWVVAEGRYEPANFPSFLIDDQKLVWDWDTQSSNYGLLKKEGFDATQGKGWLIEAAYAISGNNIGVPVVELAQENTAESGYDADPTTATEEAIADVEALYGSIPPASIWVTRMTAELPKSALDKDLELGAEATQDYVFSAHYISPNNTTGTPPKCPGTDGCGNGGSGSGSGQDSGGCGVSPGGSAPFGTALLAGAAGLATALLRRRRRR
ncbi:MAG: DUF2330 domain-containing protein [Polyangiaceae bacterium]